MSRNSDYFKKIQMNLFDLLNLNPVDKFKGRDLLGPLKYLDNTQEKEIDSAAEITLSETNQTLQNPPSESVNKSMTSSATESIAESNEQMISYDDYIMDMPLIVHRKPYLRHIRFYVKPNSTIHVVAPLNRPLELIKKEISEHKLWIQKCDQNYQKLRDQFPVRLFQTGQKFPLMGEDFFLRLDAAEFKKPFMQIDLDQFQFFYPVSWDNLKKSEKLSLLKKHLMKFYHEKAVFHLNQRVRILSESTGLTPKRLTFRNQKTRWGSCSSDGSLNLNWKLIAFDESLIDYVIIHELCHLKHPNHSKRFWTLVEAHCPNYKRLNKQLNQAQFEVDFLAAESELYFSNPTLL